MSVKTKNTVIIILTFVVGLVLGGFLTMYTGIEEMGSTAFYLSGGSFRRGNREEGDTCSRSLQCQAGLICENNVCTDPNGGGRGSKSDEPMD